MRYVVSIMTAAVLGVGCAHQPLALATSRDEAAYAPPRDGISAWAKQSAEGIDLGAGLRAGDAADHVETTIETAYGPTFGLITSALRFAAPVAQVFDFETAHSKDGVVTMARELGPKVLSIHLAPGLFALHWADIAPPM